jgi:hypothetical protein
MNTTPKSCRHLETTTRHCVIADLLYAAAIPTSPEACIACTQSNPSQDENEVTLSLAISGAHQAHDQEVLEQLLDRRSPNTRSSKRLSAILAAHGVGSQLWKLLESLGVKHTADCSCLIWAELMNKWGPSRCRDARAEIVAHMEASAKNYSWTRYVVAATKIVVLRLMFKISITDPYGSLVDESIRLAEIAEEQQQCLPKSGPTG